MPPRRPTRPRPHPLEPEAPRRSGVPASASAAAWAPGRAATPAARDQGSEGTLGIAHDAARLRGRSDAHLHAAPEAARPYSKDAMPMGPHRTSTVPVNLRDLERVFDDGAEATARGHGREGPDQEHPHGRQGAGAGRELTKKLAVTAHSFSASAREKIEQAGGSTPTSAHRGRRSGEGRRPSPSRRSMSQRSRRSRPRRSRPRSLRREDRSRCSPG